MAFGYGFKSFNKFAFFENQGILGWSIRGDCLKAHFRIPKESAFERKLTTSDLLFLEKKGWTISSKISRIWIFTKILTRFI